MSQVENWKSLKPFLSVVIVIATLFGMVFIQMEERRMGYEILKLNREQRKRAEENRMKESQIARMMRPQQIFKNAEKATLRRVQESQVIHLSGVLPSFRTQPERRGIN